MKPKTLGAYINGLNAFAKAHPEAMGHIVVTSMDDEGNGFNQVYYDPTLGVFEQQGFGGGEFQDTVDNANAVCVN